MEAILRRLGSRRPVRLLVRTGSRKVLARAMKLSPLPADSGYFEAATP